MIAVRLLFVQVLFLALLVCSIGVSAQVSDTKGKIIIVLDDVGYRQSDIQAFSLPVEVAFAILPQTPHAKSYAELAHEQGRDVMLHLPMASTSNALLGPSALTAGMYGNDIEFTLNQALDSVPHVIGVNNHMGSALTTEPIAMNNLMHALKKRSLFFLDSRTTPHSIAYETARKVGLPTDKRHIFLDHVQSETFYQNQLMRLIKIAKKYGRAIGIAHPYPSSLEFLSRALVDLDQHGVELYPVSEFFGTPEIRDRQPVRLASQMAAPSDE